MTGKPRSFIPGLFSTVLRRLVTVFFRPIYTESKKMGAAAAQSTAAQKPASAKVPTEPIPPAAAGKRKPAGWARSVFIRVVDCGSSNAAEQEILAMFNPVYDAERLGFHLVASPRHADLLLVTGPVTRNMQAALLAAFRAMPEPRRVVTLGDDLGVNSVFNPSYAVVPLPDEVAAARIAHIPGDPPTPEAILEALVRVV